MAAPGAASSRAARFDRRVRTRLGVTWMAGVDEVGRGCLAGPVVVAAVALPPDVIIEGVRDSKVMTLRQRERAYEELRRSGARWMALAVGASEVDRLNGLAASLYGMNRVVRRLEQRYPEPVDHVLVDGHLVPEGLAGRATAVVKGDGRSHCIGAASVVAKVLRDRLMRAWGRRHPLYGFERHVGYPTPEHLSALRRYGPCHLHRRSFAPVAASEAQLRLTLEA